MTKNNNPSSKDKPSTDKKPSHFAVAQEAVSAVGGLMTGIAAVTGASVSAILVMLSSSPTMRWFIGAGGFLGLVFGYLYYSLGWKGVSHEARLKAWRRCFGMLCVCLVVFAISLSVVSVTLASQYSWIEQVREFLLSAPLVMNFVFMIESMWLNILIAGLFILLSPTMKRGA